MDYITAVQASSLILPTKMGKNFPLGVLTRSDATALPRKDVIPEIVAAYAHYPPPYMLISQKTFPAKRVAAFLRTYSNALPSSLPSPLGRGLPSSHVAKATFLDWGASCIMLYNLSMKVQK